MSENRKNLKMVKAHKGNIFAGVISKDDVIYFKITRVEAIYQMDNDRADEQFWLTIDEENDLYIHSGR